MRTAKVHDEPNGTFAGVDHEEDYEVISQHPLPVRFAAAHKSGPKYVLTPSIAGLVVGAGIVLFAMNYKQDIAASFAFAVVLFVGGLFAGNVRVRNLKSSFAAHPSVHEIAEESGVSTKEIADLLCRFALGLENEDVAVVGSDTKMFVNLREHEDGKPLPQEAQSFGLLRKTAAS